MMETDTYPGDPTSGDLDDPQTIIENICQRLENSGDDCLFLRVSNQGKTCMKVGTRNALLFAQNKPQLVEEFQKFCSGVYSTLGAAVTTEKNLVGTKTLSRSGIQTGSEDRDRDIITEKVSDGPTQTEVTTEDKANMMRTRSHKTGEFNNKLVQSSSNTKTTTDVTGKKIMAGVKQGTGTDCKNDNSVIQTSACVQERSNSNIPEEQGRPKRKISTPSLLSLYETNLQRPHSTIHQNVAQNFTPIEKSVSSVPGSIEKNCKTRPNQILLKFNFGGNVCQKNKESEVASKETEKSSSPSCSKETESKRGEKEILTEKDKVVTYEDKVCDDDNDPDNDPDYDPDNDPDYDVKNDETSSTESHSCEKSLKDSYIKRKKVEKIRLRCKNCHFVFSHRRTLNRHLRNKVCANALSRREAKQAKLMEKLRKEQKVVGSNVFPKKDQTLIYKCQVCESLFISIESLKRHWDEKACVTIRDVQKAMEDSKSDDKDQAKKVEDKRTLDTDNTGKSSYNTRKSSYNTRKSSDNTKKLSDNTQKLSNNTQKSSNNTQKLSNNTQKSSDKRCDKSPNKASAETEVGENSIISAKSSSKVNVTHIKFEKVDGGAVGMETENPAPANSTNGCHSKGKFSCNTCDFPFSSKATLKKHKDRGTCTRVTLGIQPDLINGQKNLTCETCGKTFKSSVEFLRHCQRHKMTQSSRFPCTVCGSEFVHDGERVRHLLRYHKLKGPIDCLICLHSYQNYVQYRKHKRYCRTTLKCEGEATPRPRGLVDKENVNTGIKSSNLNAQEIISSYLGRVSPQQGEITEIDNPENEMKSSGETPSVNIKVKLSSGSVISVKDTMVTSSFVADADNSKDFVGDSMDVDAYESASCIDASTAQKNPSELTEGSSEDKKVLSTVGGNSEGAEETTSKNTLTLVDDVNSVVCTKCNKDVRGLFTKDLGEFVCKFCRRTYVNSFQLKKHMATHTASTLYSCHLCNKCFTETRYLQRHIIDVHRERYSICQFCCALFSTRIGLHRHLREKHPDQGDNMCSVCNKEFPDKIATIEHEDKHARERNRQYICEVCGKTLRSQRTLFLHLAWHKDIRPFACEICNKRFRTRKNLMNHLPIHSDVKTNQCEICGQCFKLKETLRCHKRVHIKEKLFECKQCGQRFRSTDGLNGHMVSSHLTAEEISSLKFKVRQCNLCGKYCTTKQIYQRHMAKHTGERPFHCQYCPRSYSLNNMLLRHVRTVHQRAEVHTCLLCHCQISSNSKWWRHLRTRKHQERCEERGIATGPGENGMVEGIHFKIGLPYKKIDNDSTDQGLSSGITETQEAQNVEYNIQGITEVQDSGFIQQITEEVHDSDFIHQITGEVQNSDYIQQITEVVQNSEYAQEIRAENQNPGYIKQIATEAQAAPGGPSTTVMEIVYQDQSESQTAVNSITEGSTLQNVVFLKVVSKPQKN